MEFAIGGALVHARDAESDPGFCRGALSLLPVAVDQWAQCVFVNTDPDAVPLRRAHPRLEPLAAEGGFDPDPERDRPHREAVFDIAANWTLWYDNGVECYHCPSIHGESFAAAFDVSPERNVPVLTDHLMNRGTSASRRSASRAVRILLNDACARQWRSPSVAAPGSGLSRAIR